MAEELKDQGNAAFKAGNFEEAAEHFTAAIELDPTNYVLFSNRSAAYASLKRYDAALQDAKQTVELKPDWARGYSRLGAAHHGLRQWDDAVQAYTKGLELDPSNAQMKQGLSDARAAAAPPPPRPSGPTTSFSPYSSAPLARQPGPSGELVLMLAHLVLIVSAVLTVQPLSRRLSWQAYFLFCRTALVAGAYKIFLRFGTPALRPFPAALGPWLQSIAVSTEFFHLLLSTLMLQAPQLWMAVVPLAALAAYPLLAALGARFGSHPLWQRYGRPAQDLLEANKANVLRFATTMELTAGFSLVLSILGSGLRGAMLAYVYWNTLRMRYWAPESRPYHQQAWALLHARVQPLLARFPAAQRYLDYPVRWFQAVGQRAHAARNAMSREAPRQVWLPGSGVWAALGPAVQPGSKNARSEAPGSSSGRRRGPQLGEPERGGGKRSREPSPSHLNASGRRQESQEPERDASAAPPARSAAAAERHTAALTGYALQQDVEDSDVEEVEAPPTCPICLVDIIDLSDKAVVTPCMHEFCHDCIWRWVSNHKRVCPLCKARVGSVLYDITPSGTYKERDVPPSPKVRSVGSGDAGVADAPLLQRLQDFLGVAGLVDPYEQQQQQVRLRQQSGSGRVGYGSRERQAQQAQQQRGGAAAAAGAAAGPRPYFWRLQQRLGSYRPGGGWGAAAGGSGLGEGPVSDENYALLFRRQVYDNDLWAVPLSTQAPRISLGSGMPQERRLTDWIERELRALLQTDDVTIIRGFVMGLLVAYGLEPFSAAELEGGSSSHAQQAQQAQQAARQAAVTARQRAAAMVAAAGGSSRTGGQDGPSGSEAGSAAVLSRNPVEALQPFLYEHSEHFWHELRCFATSPPYTIATYDRTVQYRRRPVAPPAPAAGAAAGASTGRPSRWDQRQLASQPQQAQQPSRPIQPARVVHQAGGIGSRGGQPAEPDADAPRRTSGSSRNPSPPALLSRAAAAAGAASLPQQAQQQQQRGGERRHRRSRSRSRSRQRRRRHSPSHGWQRRRSYSRDNERSRSRSRSRHRSSRRSRHSGQHSQWRSRGRSRSREQRQRYVSPSQYIAGQEDGGDRWAME